MDSKVLQRRQIWKDFLLYLLGIVLCYSAYVSILNLQSSMNISEGVGITAASVSFAVSFFCVLFCVPTIVRVLKLKTCIIISEIGLLIYILGNYYAAFYTLVPAALFSGFAEGLIWTAMSLINVVFGSKFAMLGTKGKDVYIHKMSGYFFTAFQMCQVIGNVLSSILLYSTASMDVIKNFTSNQSTVNASTTSVSQYAFCGSKDCQDKRVVTENIIQYVPDKVAKFILLSVLVGMCISGILLHVCCLNLNNDDMKHVNSSVNMKPGETNGNAKLILTKEETNKIEPSNNFQNPNLQISVWKFFIKTLKQTFKQMSHPRIILLAPLSIYSGLYMAFVFSELTRSYASCVIGVETVGICMAIFGISDALFSFIYGKFGKIVGRAAFLFIIFCMDIGLWVYCLLNTWSTSNSWIIYLIFFIFGIGDGVWQTATNVLFLEHFPEDQDISISLWNMSVCTGLALQFGISRFLCVDTKIYIMMCGLVLGCICTGVAELMYKKEQKLIVKIKEENIEEINPINKPP